MSEPGPETDGASQTSINEFMAECFPGRRLDRVLLINPPDADLELFQPKLARRGGLSNFPPYGLGVLATHLRKIDVVVEILNLNHAVLKDCSRSPEGAAFDVRRSWQRAFDDAVNDFAPDLIGVTCMFTMTHASLAEVCERAGLTGCPIAIGGVHITNDVARVMADIPNANLAFLREADVSLPNFVRAVRGELAVDELGQIAYRHNGRLHQINKECQPNSEQMDVLPAYGMMAIGELSEFGVIGSFHGFKPANTRYATVLSNRGCRARCSFCSVRTFNGKGVRQRSVESVLDELEILEQEYGIEHIMWLDDDLFKDERRALRLFDGMVRRGLKLSWDASNGVIASSCTDELVAASAASKCVGLIIGMESGNPEILRRTFKPGTVEVFLKAAEILRKYEEIYSNVYLMLGFPNETMGMIMDTIDVAREMNLDWYRIKPLQPLPNTPIYDEMLDEGLIGGDIRNEVRYVTGPYGKHHELTTRETGYDIEEYVMSIPREAIPTPEQIEDIWFYMNYHLNYERIFAETRKIKLEQHRMYLRSISDIISPDNAFALCLANVVNSRLGQSDIDLTTRLQDQLSNSPVWRARFAAFGLDKEIPSSPALGDTTF